MLQSHVVDQYVLDQFGIDWHDKCARVYWQ
jgi:hypothetical protein